MHITDGYDLERLLFAGQCFRNGAVDFPYDRVHVMVIAVSQQAQYGEVGEVEPIGEW